MPTLGVKGMLFFILVAHHNSFQFCVATSAREYRKVEKRTVKKTMSHRKQILVSTSVASQPDEDEVAVNPRMLKTLVLCAVRKLLAKTMSCGCNVTGT